MKKEIESIRDNLKRAAQHECAQAQPLIATLDRQLKGWAKADEADKSVLRDAGRNASLLAGRVAAHLYTTSKWRMTMLAFLAVAPALTQTEEATTAKPSLPTFRPRWWYHANRLDARPVAWSLRNHPQDWRWQTEDITLIHVPSKHVFWVGNGPMFYGLHEADCSCRSTRGKFQRLQARFVFGPAYRQWRRNQGPAHDPEHFASHFVR